LANDRSGCRPGGARALSSISRASRPSPTARWTARSRLGETSAA